MPKTLKKFLLLFSICIVVILAEGIFSLYFKHFLYAKNYEIVIQLEIVLLTFFGLYVSNQWVYLLPLMTCLIYDMYYSPFVAFYTIAMMLCFSLVRSFKNMQPTFLRDFFLITITLMCFNSFLYVEALTVGFQVVNFPDYLSLKIMPTVLLNSLMFIILYIPLKHFIQRIKFSD